jgi:hypothetical protein
MAVQVFVNRETGGQLALGRFFDRRLLGERAKPGQDRQGQDRQAGNLHPALIRDFLNEENRNAGKDGIDELLSVFLLS